MISAKMFFWILGVALVVGITIMHGPRLVKRLSGGASSGGVATGGVEAEG